MESLRMSVGDFGNVWIYIYFVPTVLFTLF